MTYEELLALTDAGIEIWKPVPGYEGYYEISNLGRVKSIDRCVSCKGHPHHVREHIKSTTLTATGYPAVSLSKNRKVVQIPIHQILMGAFVPKPIEATEIDHINTIKTDNRFQNLRWVTHKENMNNSITIQHFKADVNSEEQKQRRLYTRKLNGGRTAPITVYQYTKEGAFVALYSSTFEAQRATGIHCTAIRRVLDDSTQAAGEYIWFTSPQENVHYTRRLPKNTKPIIQYDLEGNLLKEWDSATDIKRGLGFNNTMIAKSIAHNHPYKGYIFKYKEEDVTVPL